MSRGSTATVPMWEDITAVLVDVLEEVRVVVDNGRSSDRLDYGRRTETGRTDHSRRSSRSAGERSPRGLTLEGLCVSYFTRTPTPTTPSCRWAGGSATGPGTRIYRASG